LLIAYGEKALHFRQMPTNITGLTWETSNAQLVNSVILIHAGQKERKITRTDIMKL
jgi:hypothetical protein